MTSGGRHSRKHWMITGGVLTTSMRTLAVIPPIDVDPLLAGRRDRGTRYDSIQVNRRD